MEPVSSTSRTIAIISSNRYHPGEDRHFQLHLVELGAAVQLFQAHDIYEMLYAVILRNNYANNILHPSRLYNAPILIFHV